MQLSGYYLKSGCCGAGECCCEDVSAAYCCDCCLYSWSLQISDNNETWKTIHKVEKDVEMRRCKEKTFKFSNTFSAKYVRLLHDESCQGDPPYLVVNKFELIGTKGFGITDDQSVEGDEDDISIIGHILKHMH